MSRPQAQFIHCTNYESIERFCDTVTADLLRRIAPRGEYALNIIRRLPGGEHGDAARELLAWCELRATANRAEAN